MVVWMKTTLNIDDQVMARLRQTAVQRGTTMSALVEAALRRLLDGTGDKEPPLEPLPSWSGGAPTVDPADRTALYDVMGGR